jgi:hypothetical protein
MTPHAPAVPAYNACTDSHDMDYDFWDMPYSTGYNSRGTFGPDMADSNYIGFFYSPEVLFNNKALQGTHYKLENIHRTELGVDTVTYYDAGVNELRMYTAFSPGYLPEIANRKINQNIFVGYDSFDTNSFGINYSFTYSPGNVLTYTGISNLNHQQKAQFSQLQNHLDIYISQNNSIDGDDTPFMNAGISSYNDGYQSRSQPNLIAENHGYYASIKDEKIVYSDLESLEYMDTSSNIYDKSITGPIEIWGGDTFISRVDMKKSLTHWLYGFKYGPMQNMETRLGAMWDSFDTDAQGHFVTHMSFMAESTINSDLRHEGGTWDKRYYPKSYYPTIDVYLTVSDEGLFDPNTNVPENWFAYNKDFSLENTIKKYQTTNYVVDFCSECYNENRNRLWISEKSLQEEKQDLYRKILANNYNDIFPDSGEITGLFVESDQLYTHLTNALVFVPTRSQELQTNEGTISVGTGAILSIPPKRLFTVNSGYAGTQHDLATLQTMFGTIFIDEKNKQIIRFNGQANPEIISAKGMKSWFNQNLPFVLSAQYKQLSGQEYPDYLKNNPYGSAGIGYVTTYDNKFKRIIITKRDYAIAPDYIEGFVVIDSSQSYAPEQVIAWNNHLGFDTYTDRFVLIQEDSGGLVTTNLSFNNQTYFIDNGWTMSYNLERGFWVSWHSYKPTFYMYDSDTFYSKLDRDFNFNTGAIWRHQNEITNYQTYYNVQFPSMIEIVVVPDEINNKNFNAVYYVADAYQYNTTKKQFVLRKDDSYTGYIAYNTDQSTGDRYLFVVPEYPYLNSFVSLPYDRLVKQNGIWRFNGMWDVVIDHDQPFFTQEWSDSNYRSQFSAAGISQGYIDKVSDSSNLNQTMNMYEVSRMTDKFMHVRLIYSSEGPGKLVTNVVLTYNRNLVY